MKKRLLSFLMCLALLVGVLPAIPAAAASAEELAATGTSASSPWLVDDWNELKLAFTTKLDSNDGDTVYLKLNADITYDSYEQGTLVTNGFNVVLDLGGYTLKCVDSSNNSFHLIHASNGTVTITDSERYDEATGKWYTGKIDYLYTLPDRDTSVLSGNIIIKGGTIVNRTHFRSGSPHFNSVYTNAGKYSAGTYIGTYKMGWIKVYGGTLEGDYPLYLGYRSGSGVYGGTMIVKHNAAITVEYDDADSVFSAGILPEIGEFAVRSATDTSFFYDNKEYEAVLAFDVMVPKSYANTHTVSQMNADFSGRFVDGLVAYIDGKRQWKVDEGVIYPTAFGSYYTKIWGPIIESTYRLVIPETVSHMELTIPEPEPGEEMSYRAFVPAGSGYRAASSGAYAGGTWKQGVQWTDGNNWSNAYQPGSTFEAGKKYEVFIEVEITDSRKYSFASSGMTATINGKTATLNKNDDGTYWVYRSFDVKKKQIDSIALTVTEPVVNGTPDYSAAVPANADYAVETNGVFWMDASSIAFGPAIAADAKFEANKKYTVSVIVESADPVKYEFADSDSITATVNGHEANVIPYSSTRLAVWYTFDLNTLISNIALTIPEAFEGDQLLWEAESDSATYQIDTTQSTYYLNGVSWYKGDSHITNGALSYFEAGATYRAVIIVKPAEGYQFADVANQTFTVNGQAASCSGYTSGLRMVSYTFTVKHTIDTVDISIAPPTPGEELSYDPILPDDADYTVSIKLGKMWKNGTRWEANKNNLIVADHPVAAKGVDYTVNIIIKPKDEENYQFAKIGKLEVTLNGAIPHKYWLNKNECFIEHIFPASVPATIVDSVDVTITEPKAGEALSYDAKVVNGEGCVVSDYSEADRYLHGVIWTDIWNYMDHFPVGTIAEPGKSYAAVIKLEVTDPARYQFPDKEYFSATVNGKFAWATKISDTEYTISANFTVPGGCLVGDVNADTQVTNRDSMILDRYVAGWEGYEQRIIIMDAADLNRDTQVTNRDAIILDRVAAGWEGYYDKYIIMV